MIETEISLLRQRTGLEQRYKVSRDSIILVTIIVLLCHTGLRQQEASRIHYPSIHDDDKNIYRNICLYDHIGHCFPLAL